jgi:uncharacterized alkaline shock family protein YloU
MSPAEETELIGLEFKSKVVSKIVGGMVKQKKSIAQLAAEMDVDARTVKRLLDVSNLNTRMEILADVSIALNIDLRISLTSKSPM